MGPRLRGVHSEQGDVMFITRESSFRKEQKRSDLDHEGEPDSSGMLVEDRLATLTQKSAL